MNIGSTWDKTIVNEAGKVYNYGDRNTLFHTNIKVNYDSINIHIPNEFNLNHKISSKKSVFNCIKERLEKKSTTTPWKRYKPDHLSLSTRYTIKRRKGKEYEIHLIQKIDKPFFFVLRILQPDLHIVRFVKVLLRPYSYNISQLELAFDFRPRKIGVCYSSNTKQSDPIRSLYNALKSVIYLKWRGKKMMDIEYDTTTYLNNIRKTSTKGVRIYIDKNNGEFVRVEEVIKRRFLKKMFGSQLKGIS